MGISTDGIRSQLITAGICWHMEQPHPYSKVHYTFTALHTTGH